MAMAGRQVEETGSTVSFRSLDEGGFLYPALNFFMSEGKIQSETRLDRLMFENGSRLFFSHAFAKAIHQGRGAIVVPLDGVAFLKPETLSRAVTHKVPNKLTHLTDAEIMEMFHALSLEGFASDTWTTVDVGREDFMLEQGHWLYLPHQELKHMRSLEVDSAIEAYHPMRQFVGVTLRDDGSNGICRAYIVNRPSLTPDVEFMLDNVSDETLRKHHLM